MLGRRGRQEAPLQALGHVGQRRDGGVVRGGGGRHRRRAAVDHSTIAWTTSAPTATARTTSRRRPTTPTRTAKTRAQRSTPGTHPREEPPPEAQQQQPAAHAVAARVVVEVAGAARVQRAREVAPVVGEHARLQGEAGVPPQHGVLRAREVLDEREEPVVGGEPGVRQPDLQVQAVLGGVVLDLAAPAPAVEEVAQEPVEVARDALDVRSLHHAHASILPIPSSIGSRTRWVESKEEAGRRGSKRRRSSAIECPTWWGGRPPPRANLQEHT